MRHLLLPQMRTDDQDFPSNHHTYNYIKPELRKRKLNESILLLSTILILIIFTSLPYIFGYWRGWNSSTKVFMGLMFDVADNTQYMGWIREMQKSWVISNPLTPEPTQAVFFNLLWGLLAQSQNLTGFETEWTLQLLRIGSIIIWSLLTWNFCKFILIRPLAYQTAYLLIMFGSGWGWISILIKQFTGTLTNPTTVILAEPNTFLSALALPHNIFSAGLMLMVFLMFLKSGEEGSIGWAFTGGFLNLLLGLIHAYDLIIVYAVLGIYTLIICLRAKRIVFKWAISLTIIGLVSTPPPLYFFYLINNDVNWRNVLSQYKNAGVFTPDPLNLILLMGPLLPLAFFAFRSDLHKQQNSPLHLPGQRLLLVKVWLITGLFLIYFPTNFQIKMLDGWQVPVFMLAVVALLDLSDWRLLQLKLSSLLPKFKLQIWICSLALLISLPTTIYYFSWRFVDLDRARMPYYLERDEVAAFNWLEQTNEIPVIIFASEELGQYLAARTGHRPFLAHWAMTLDFYTKRQLVAEVFNPATTPQRRREILITNSVRYVLHGAAEKKIAPELSAPGLTRVFVSPLADVYLVNQPGGAVRPYRRIL